ncbi:hypothetical protein AB0M22_32790 [Nocardia sp. NPDC051756]|uniref:hypothetical protein n=1 Tax=Nocardia sp. NPDC051756 TaxID=3154751 RepID=UPI00342A2447
MPWSQRARPGGGSSRPTNIDPANSANPNNAVGGRRQHPPRAEHVATTTSTPTPTKWAASATCARSSAAPPIMPKLKQAWMPDSSGRPLACSTATQVHAREYVASETRK